MRIQKRVKGGRKSLPSCVLKEIRTAIEKLAREHKVSKSFVVATILSEALNIKIQEKYYE